MAGRWKMGPNGGYFDSQDSGPDQYQPTANERASVMAPTPMPAVPMGNGSGAMPDRGPAGMNGRMPGSPAPMQASDPSMGNGGVLGENYQLPDGSWRYGGNGPGDWQTTDMGMPGGEMAQKPSGGPMMGAGRDSTGNPYMGGGSLADILKQLQMFYQMQRTGGLGTGAAGAATRSLGSGGRMAVGALGSLFR